jgi:hypothetical protein
MSIFTFIVIGSAGAGPVAAGWIEQNPHLRWRWIQWVTFMCVSSISEFYSPSNNKIQSRSCRGTFYPNFHVGDKIISTSHPDCQGYAQRNGKLKVSCTN